MTPVELAAHVERVVELVSRGGGTTIREIQNVLGAHMPVDGDLWLGLGGANIYWAVGVSDEIAQVMEAVRRDGRAVPVPSNALVYAFDGAAIPLLPLARRVPKTGGYKTPHWMPVVFWLRERVQP